MDFAALPPEINSARIYSGPGSGPMLAAATAWAALAAELTAAACGYGSVLSELTGDGWLGPAALSMANAAAPYVSWLHSTAASAEQAAAQAKAAAAAYEVAFVMTVPPPVVAANRSLLLALIATNFFGQNAPAIAATEMHYSEMWIQDAGAMDGYAAAAASASRLNPFTEPPQTTNPSGLAAQSGVVAHAAAKAAGTQPGAAPQPLAAPTVSPTWVDYLERVPNEVNTVLSFGNAATSGRGIFILNSRLAFQAAQEASVPAGELGQRLLSSVAAAPGVSASIGRAAPVGLLPAPPGWAAPEIVPSQPASPTASAAITPIAGVDTPPVPGSVFSQSVLGTLSRDGYDAPRAKSKPVIVRSPAAG